MRVAQLLFSGLGGHGSVVFSILDGGASATWDNALLFYGIDEINPAYVKACDARGVEHGHVRTRMGRPWASWDEVSRWLEHTRPDAVVLHSVTALPPVLAYARRRGIPLIAVEHTPNAVKSRAERVFSGLCMLLADRVVMLTDEYVAESARMLGPLFRPRKVSVIPNGIDTDVFAPQARASAPFTIGMAARMAASKRQDVLIRALAILRSSAPELDWRMSLAGDGERAPALRELVAELRLDEVVDLPGMLDEPALVRWFGGIDLYAHASDGETLSTSLLQAMSCGLPIVASAIPGISNLLGGTVPVGVLVDAQTPEAFARALRELRADPRRDQLASAARERAVARHGQRAMFTAYDAELRRATRVR